MAFSSILWASSPHGGAADPEALRDLHLDEIFAAACRGREEYRLEELFASALLGPEDIRYRHEVWRDLEDAALREALADFALAMRSMRQKEGLARKVRNPDQRARWHLAAAEAYVSAVGGLADGLEGLAPRSRGLGGLGAYLADLRAGDAFAQLARETADIAQELRAVRYRFVIDGTRVTVDHPQEEADYSLEIARTFERFRQGGDAPFKAPGAPFPEMNRVEAQILERVALLEPDLFARLRDYARRRADFTDAVVVRFDREIQLYLGYLEAVAGLRAGGLGLCLPTMDPAAKEERVSDAYDLALALGSMRERRRVVPNDYALAGQERVLVVTGPNQGGKTTFARCFGQLHHLGGLGLPVPARAARLFLPDRVYSHFERKEQPEDLQGRLGEELERIRDILREATPQSVVVMNESFSSTTLHDARLLGGEVLQRILAKGMLCAYVTFVDELASLAQPVVSMVAEVRADDPAVRTYRVVRAPANGLAFALAIAERHGLTYQALRRRLRP